MSLHRVSVQYADSGSLCGMTFNLSGSTVWFQDVLVLYSEISFIKNQRGFWDIKNASQGGHFDF